MWYSFYCLTIRTDACSCKFAGLVCFLHLSIMLGVIMQIAYCLTNIFIRDPRVSILLPISDEMGMGVLTPTYRLEGVFTRLLTQFVLSHSQAFLGFLDLDLKFKESLDSLIFLIGPNLITIIGWGLRSGTLISQGQPLMRPHITYTHNQPCVILVQHFATICDVLYHSTILYSAPFYLYNLF